MAQYSNLQNSTGLDGENNDNDNAVQTAVSKRYLYTILERCVGYHCDKNTSCFEVRHVFLNKHKSPTMGQGGFGRK